MDDNQKFDNNGTPVGREPETFPPPYFTEPEEPVKRRRVPWTKIAAIFILAGIVMMGVGWFSGADRGGNVGFRDGRLVVFTSSSEDMGEVFIPIDNPRAINHLDILTTSANIIVETATSGQTSGIYLTNIDSDVVSIEGDTITINTREVESNWIQTGTTGNNRRQRQNGLNFITDWNLNITAFNITPYIGGRREIRILLPADESFGIFRLNSTSGGVRINNLNADAVYARTTSGTIRASRIESEQLILSSTSGTIRMENIRATYLDATAVSGSIRGENVITGYSELQSTSGSINIDNVGWHTMTARSVSGTIRLSDAQIRLTGNPEHGTSLQTTSGSAHLEIVSGTLQDFSYAINTTSGTMRVNSNRVTTGRSASHISGDHLIEIRTVSGSVRLDFD